MQPLTLTLTSSIIIITSNLEENIKFCDFGFYCVCFPLLLSKSGFPANSAEAANANGIIGVKSEQYTVLLR